MLYDHISCSVILFVLHTFIICKESSVTKQTVLHCNKKPRWYKEPIRNVACFGIKGDDFKTATLERLYVCVLGPGSLESHECESNRFVRLSWCGTQEDIVSSRPTHDLHANSSIVFARVLSVSCLSPIPGPQWSSSFVATDKNLSYHFASHLSQYSTFPLFLI